MKENYYFEINKIKLKNEQEIKPNKINIIIGPNNAGKSKFLRELSGFFYKNNEQNYIIDDIDCKLPSSFESLYNSYDLKDKIVIDSNGSKRLRAYYNNQSSYFYPYFNNIDYISKSNLLDSYGCLFLSYLGTENRLTMIKSQRCETDLNSNINFLTAVKDNSMYNKNEILENLSKTVKKIFKKDIIFDKTTKPGTLCFRTGLDLEYYRKASKIDTLADGKLSQENLLDNEGDGLKSFVSTYLSLKLEEKNEILLDEPESFLHPPLARQLGEIIGESAKEGRQIFITTHSAEILKGILSKCKDVNVIRITRSENTNNVTMLDNKTLKQIIEEPKLRVSKVLEGLFCENVAITEAEADEIFYQEFLDKIEPQSGIFFTHVNNKQNICTVSEIYNSLNVDNMMIFDFDILRKREEFAKALNVAKVESKKINSYLEIAEEIRTYIKSIIGEAETEEDKEKIKSEMDKYYHSKGIRILPEDLRNKTEDMLEYLQIKNIFILYNGELETCLEDASISYIANKNNWITEAINCIDNKSKDELINLEISKFISNIKDSIGNKMKV